MAKNFLYLAAVLDWHSCHVLSWQLSNTHAFMEHFWRTVKWKHIYLNPAYNGP